MSRLALSSGSSAGCASVRASSPDARSDFLRGLLPPRALERDHAAAALAFKLRKDVQPELVDIDRAHRELAHDSR